MTVIWTREALLETKLIYQYYKATVSVKIANNIKRNIFSSVNNLTRLKRKGPIEQLLLHRKGEYRYLVAGNYKVIYRISASEIYIIKVFDCRQNPEKVSH